jgi:hypothetical protein
MTQPDPKFKRHLVEEKEPLCDWLFQFGLKLSLWFGVSITLLLFITFVVDVDWKVLF